MPLSERVFTCGGCGQVIDRDLNASLNLECAPDFLVRSARAEFTPVDKQEPTLLDEAGSRPFKSNLD
jgi:putative transposase